LVIALIGLARGYHQELGNSIIFMFTIAALGFIGNNFEDRLKEIGVQIFGVQNTDTFLMLFYTVTLIIVAFASYSGTTFVFGGKPKGGLLGGAISFGVGLFNGYLLAGSLWYYANAFGYPFVSMEGGLSETANAMIALLPQNLFPNPVYWVIPPTVLMILRVKD
jgi:hypothetical protein